jgi:hypothetical protein
MAPLALVGLAAGGALAAATVVLARGVFRPFAERFPEKDARDGIEWRNHQSINVHLAPLVWANASWGFSLGLDDEHVHFNPGKVLRAFGALPFSVPREAIEVEKRHGNWATVRIGETRLEGPAWCLAPQG